MSTPAAKRRRIDNVLLKPFQSPLRTVKPNLSSNSPSTPLSNPPATPISKTPAPPASAPSRLTNTPLRRVSKPAFSPRPRVAADPVLAARSAEVQKVERELHELRAEVEMMEQARKIERDGKMEELEGLVAKWTEASRAAAEEMFGVVRDRVNRMGGTRVWMDMQKKKRDWGNGGFDEPEKRADDEGEGSGLDKRDLYAEYDVDPEAVREEEAEYEAGEDDAFTMEMMFKPMNVDLKVIGWDKDQQRWVD